MRPLQARRGLAPTVRRLFGPAGHPADGTTDAFAVGWWPRGIRLLAGEVVEDDWPHIDATWEQFRRKHGMHLRRDTGLEPHAFLVEALGQAHSSGLLLRLATELIKEDLVTEQFGRRLEKVLRTSIYQMQAFQGGVFRPVNALVAAKDMIAACDQVCRIDVEGSQTGTGVQVSRTLVATAAHVIWPLVAFGADGSPDLRADGSLRARAGSVGKLTLTFGDAVDYMSEDSAGTRRMDGEIASLHSDWLAWGSQPTEKESAEDLLDVADIDGISPDTGPWDLALIRLAAPRRTARPTCLLAADPPSQPFQINILHHPHGATDQGEPLLWSVGQLDSQLGDPPVRCLHDASTLRGSSGAPVFDARWRMVALHQGGERDLQSAGDAKDLAEDSRNRAVPIRPWCGQLDGIERLTSDQGPYLTVLTTSPDLTPHPYPVIGRRETQQRVWRALAADATAAERLLIIRGEPGTGRRFTKRLVREMVTMAGDGLVVTLSTTNALNETAAGFAGRVTGVLSAQLLQSHAPQLTTLERNVRSSLVPSLGDQLEELTRGRATWLVLEGFDEPGTELPSSVKDLIVDLLSQLDRYSALRMVLVGWPETPAGYEESVEELRPPTAGDIAACLTPPGEMPDEELVEKIQFVLDVQPGGYPAAQQLVARLAEKLRETHQPDGDG
jgi:Trypsin-like peptidase domain